MASSRPWTIADKTCLVTGATSGIGRATVLELARRQAHVLAVGRDRKALTQLVDEVRREVPGARIDGLRCDLSSLDDVRRLAATVAAEHPRLDVLINNAGVSKFQRQLSADGFEMTFAVNHLAPFVLTNLLLPSLEAADEARVVTVASDVHKQVKSVDWDDLQAERRFVPREVYDRSKLCNIWFARELAARTRDTSVSSNAVSPGFVRTRLAREATGAFGVFIKLVRPFQKSPEAGAAGSVRLATVAELSGVSGAYVEKGEVVEPSALARDDAAARRLWELSAELTALPAAS